MIDLLVVWLAFICVLGAFFEKDYNRQLLLLFAISILSVNFMPDVILGNLILLVIIIVWIILVRKTSKCKK